MSDLRIARTLAVPLGLLVLLLIANPRTCGRFFGGGNARPVAATATGTSPETKVTGLIINSDVPAPRRQAVVQYPPGLDAARIQYLIEIAPQFAEPKLMPCPKTPTDERQSPILAELLRLHYVERNADGTITPTRDAIVNVNGAVDSPEAWSVPVGQRKFVSIERVDDPGDGKYLALVRWRWDPNAIGKALLPHPEDHSLSAEFGGGEHHWVLNRFVQAPDSEWK